MKRYVVGICLMFVMLCCTLSASAETIKTAWLPEYEAFAAWYAHEHAFDKKLGLEFAFEVFPTGKNLVDNMRRTKSVVGACGGTAAIFGVLNKQVRIIGVAMDEASATAIYVRTDSPVLTKKGINPAYPQLYGGAESMRGKSVLAPLGSSAHQLLLCWLERLNTDAANVLIVDTKPDEALAAFVNGMGDAVALWAPDTYKAEQAGLRRVATGRDCGITQPILLIADKYFVEQQPEKVALFMKAYTQAAEAIAQTPVDKLVPLYQRFMHDFGVTIHAEAAKRELTTYTYLPAAEQQRMVTARTEDVHPWLEDILRFHEDTGALSRQQVRQLQQLEQSTVDFLYKSTSAF